MARADRDGIAFDGSEPLVAPLGPLRPLHYTGTVNRNVRRHSRRDIATMLAGTFSGDVVGL